MGEALFSKVLVANRGEIAIRVFRTLRELGIGTVAVYSEADRASLHVGTADEAYLVGPGTPAESYLHGERILEAARQAGAEAIHPGYGFLAENAGFARACEEAGIVWIGPPPDAIDAMGSKVEARRLMSAAGVPVIPGTTDPVDSVEELVRLGDEYGWPLAVKASAGGGGKGLKVVPSAEEAERALASAKREGEAYFSDATVYVEKLIEDPRHVEVQVLADGHGNAIHLGERDCTIQRRHQKLVEETPSPAVSPELRERIGQIALDAARAVGYRSAGTIEGLLDRDGNYWFLEMNTRIQVEHTITELVTGVDLVREQVLVAAGEPLSVRQEDIAFRGHAIECRINAEDAAKGFLPAPGTITAYREPAGPGVRVDSGVEAGSEVVGIYDPMVAKLCVWDTDRERARRRMLRALEEYVVEGVTTLIGFHRALLSHQCFVDGTTCHGLVESERARCGGDPALGGCACGGRSEPGRPGARSRARGRGRRPALRRHGARARAATCRARAAPARAFLGRRRRARRREGGGRQPDAGDGALGRRGRGGRGDRRCRPLRDRGDEDGERDPRAPRRRRDGPDGGAGRGGRDGSGDLRRLRERRGRGSRLRRVSAVAEPGTRRLAPVLCSESSAERGEPLGATASRADHWILLEYRRLWSRDVLAGSGLTEEVKAHLRRQLDELPRSRLLFVKRPERRDSEGIALFFGATGEHGGRLYGLQLEAYDDVLRIDMAAALTGGAPEGDPVERLLVVCTHGKRDRCCALHGRPLYDALPAERAR